MPNGKQEQDKANKPAQKINIFVNQAKYEVNADVLTGKQILELAGEDTTQVKLALKDKGQLHQYGDLDESIPLRNGMKFIATYIGPTPVS